jgi:trk system potassium uptake protein TrkH
MNYSIIRKILGIVVQFIGAFLVLPATCGLIYREKQAIVYIVLAVVYFALGRLISSFKLSSQAYYAREGLVVVGLSWIILSVLGAIPLVITKDIPSFTDALFETVSGFTTTGSSILSDVEALSHTGLFWRSFTHWVGGMGVIVFILAVLPMTGGYNMNLMRAESPGPTVGKLVPRMKETAKILYSIYFGITVTEAILLFIVGMPLFDALCISFGSAGTGGFGVRNDSCASYTNLMQSIITVFIIMFGVNFNAYFFILRKRTSEVFKMSELKGYFGIIAFAIVTITINIRGMFPSLYQAFHHAAFQVGSIITTTGFATADFDQWPQYSRALLVAIMFVGACAGSTGGGMKVSRIMIMF